MECSTYEVGGVCVCCVTGTCSVQSDCLWKELVLYAGAGSADGNGVSSPWFGWLESLMVSVLSSHTTWRKCHGGTK